MFPMYLKHFLKSSADLHVAAAFSFRGFRRAKYSKLANMEVSIYMYCLDFICCRANTNNNFLQGGREKIDGHNISYVRAGSGPNAVLCLPGALGKYHTVTSNFYNL